MDWALSRNAYQPPTYLALAQQQIDGGVILFGLSAGKFLQIGKGRLKVVRQSLDDLGSPALLHLPLQDVAADLPVESSTSSRLTASAARC